jgi:hypothetical protein
MAEPGDNRPHRRGVRIYFSLFLRSGRIPVVGTGLNHVPQTGRTDNLRREIQLISHKQTRKAAVVPRATKPKRKNNTWATSHQNQIRRNNPRKQVRPPKRTTKRSRELPTKRSRPNRIVASEQRSALVPRANCSVEEPRIARISRMVFGEYADQRPGLNSPFGEFISNGPVSYFPIIRVIRVICGQISS